VDDVFTSGIKDKTSVSVLQCCVRITPAAGGGSGVGSKRPRDTTDNVHDQHQHQQEEHWAVRIARDFVGRANRCPGLFIGSLQWHPCPLEKGSHSGNHFTIQLRNPTTTTTGGGGTEDGAGDGADRASLSAHMSTDRAPLSTHLSARLSTLAAMGHGNFFGHQRFGGKVGIPGNGHTVRALV